MKIKQIAFILLGIFFLFQSCTIEKRLHNKGYYVEWKKFHPKEKLEIETTSVNSDPENSLNQKIADQTQNEEKIITSSYDAISEEQIQNPSEFYLIEESKEPQKKISPTKLRNNKASKNFVQKIQKKLNKRKDKNDGKETNKLAFISLSLALASFLLFFTVVPALFISAVAIRQMKAEPNRYSNKSAALFAYIFSLVVIGLTALIIGALILAFGSTAFISSMYVLAVFLGLLVGTQVIINI